MTEQQEYIWPRDANTQDMKLTPPINWHLACQRLKRKTDAQAKEQERKKNAQMD